MSALDRRSFLSGALTLPWLASQSVVADACAPPPTLDIHVHLFGVGDEGQVKGVKENSKVSGTDNPTIIVQLISDGLKIGQELIQNKF